MSISLLFACFAVAASPAQTKVIAREDATTRISTARGMAIWSTYDLFGDNFRLRLYSNGVVRTLRVKPSKVGFDVDLGVDDRGRTVAVYSRCTQLPDYFRAPGIDNRMAADGCDLYELPLRTGKERRLAASTADSEFMPSIDGHRIAYARRDFADGQSHPSLWVYDTKTRRRTELPPGTTGKFDDGGIGPLAPGPSRIDLRGGHLAVSWEYEDDGCGWDDILNSAEIWLISVRGNARRVAAMYCHYDAVEGAFLSDRSMFWLSHGADGRTGLVQYGLGSRTKRVAPSYARSEAVAGDERSLFDVRPARNGIVFEIVRAKPQWG